MLSGERKETLNMNILEGCVLGRRPRTHPGFEPLCVFSRSSVVDPLEWPRYGYQTRILGVCHWAFAGTEQQKTELATFWCPEPQTL